jgi:uncharacterized OB-fold protein
MTSEIATSELGVGRPTKRRPGSVAGGLAVADSRPALMGGRVQGSRCTACANPFAQRGLPWCPVCYGPVQDTDFTPEGRLWSSTVIALRVGQRRPPFALGYLDLDDGPRVMVHLEEPVAAPPGARAVVTRTEHGDLVATVASTR